MITIIFESHGTSLDNEKCLSSGWNDVMLSDLGIKQARELGKRRTNEKFDAIFCSDLQRSYKTAEIAFKGKFHIIQDSRLRECDYGELTQHPSSEVDKEKPKRIKKPFPGGESYEQTLTRMASFLDDLRSKYYGKKIMIVGHRATQYGLEFFINGVPLEKVIIAPWSWKPGWQYIIQTNSKRV